MIAPPRGAALLLAVSMSGCSAWQVRTAPVREAVVGPVPRTRVTLRDGARMQVWSARLEGDSLVGHLTGDTTRTAFAVADVALLETWEPSKAQTAKMTVIVVLGVAYAILQLGIAASGP
jgi:hypothetical protein